MHLGRTFRHPPERQANMASHKVSATARVISPATGEREELTLVQIPLHITPSKFDKPLTLLPFIISRWSNNSNFRHRLLQSWRKRPLRGRRLTGHNPFGITFSGHLSPKTYLMMS